MKKRSSPPNHRHDGTSPLPLRMDWSPPTKWKEREVSEVLIEDGKLLYKKSRILLDTTEGSTDSKWIFVLITLNILYKKKGTFQHSSFFAGGATSAAGRLEVRNGILKDDGDLSESFEVTNMARQDLEGLVIWRPKMDQILVGQQVAQVLLTHPYLFLQLGMLSEIILQPFYGTMGSWTAYLINVLYVEYRARKEKENVNLKNHVIQWFEVLDELLGP